MTRTTESATLPITRASGICNMGGVSSRTISKLLRAYSRISPNRGEYKSAVADGLSLPAATSDTFAKAVGRIACSMDVTPVRTSLNPGEALAPKTVCSRGLRRSASISNTRWPTSESASARFAATVVFPSPGFALVSTTVDGPASGLANNSEVRIERNEAESTGRSGCSAANSSGPNAGIPLAARSTDAAGTAPNSGNSRNELISPGD
jgi:hypothetical protein